MRDRFNTLLKSVTGLDLYLLRFLALQRLVPFQVPDKPFFDSEETVVWFVEQLKTAKRYLEYGTGGSTYAAAQVGVPFVAVESDRHFLRSVKRKIRDAGLAHENQVFCYADVGITGYAGEPIFMWRASDNRLERFRRYSDPPAQCFCDGPLPDLVLVDGRFRVACALKALRMLLNERRWKIVVDDYVDRPQYHVVERFAILSERVGSRMAVFERARDFDLKSLDETIRRYETVPA